jgi:hypothetical protein
MANLLYVVLRHEGVEKPHFDLMFQTSPGSMLATWRSPVWRPTSAITLERLPDHRTAYLTFEGEIPGGRGNVRRVEQGLCEVDRREDGWTIRLRPRPIGEAMALDLAKQSHSSWLCTSSPAD